MTCMDSYVGRKEKQHSVKTIQVLRDDKRISMILIENAYMVDWCVR